MQATPGAVATKVPSIAVWLGMAFVLLSLAIVTMQPGFRVSGRGLLFAAFSSAVLGVALARRRRTRRRREHEHIAMQAELQAHEDLLAVASHELRTPLTGLRLSLEAALRQADQASAPAALKAKLATVDSQAERLSTLVDQLLSYSRHTAERSDFALTPVDLGALVQEVIDRYADACDQAGTPTTVAIAHQPVGHWDRSALEQVLTNLLSNAMKYGRGRPIHVIVDGDQTHASFSVRDQGPGIAAHDQGRIFDRFVRASTDWQSESLGLGLWITHHHVHAMGGNVLVTSRPGEGATFIVQLPLEPPSRRRLSP